MPLTRERSMFLSAASFLASGDAKTRPVVLATGAGLEGATGAAGGGGGAATGVGTGAGAAGAGGAGAGAGAAFGGAAGALPAL